MDPNRWRDISRVYHAARALDGSKRSAYLRDACARDGELRREVQSLLDEDEEAAERLMARSALHRAAAAAEADAHAEAVAGLVGRTVGHYQVLECIGGGGMGDVFDAQDL